MRALIAALLATPLLAGSQFLADLELRPLAFDAREFKASFNQASDRLRLVVVFSPT